VLLGRGTTDNKGPLIGWIAVLIAHKEMKVPLPVNLVMCFEGGLNVWPGFSAVYLMLPCYRDGGIWPNWTRTNRSGRESKILQKHVDCICISDNGKLLTRMYKQALILNDPTAWL